MVFSRRLAPSTWVWEKTLVSNMAFVSLKMLYHCIAHLSVIYRKTSKHTNTKCVKSDMTVCFPSEITIYNDNGLKSTANWKYFILLTTWLGTMESLRENCVCTWVKIELVLFWLSCVRSHSRAWQYNFPLTILRLNLLWSEIPSVSAVLNCWVTFYKIQITLVILTLFFNLNCCNSFIQKEVMRRLDTKISISFYLHVD